MLVAVTVLAIALLIVIHELGHFLVARACGMRVDRFSVGFGPVIWKRRRGDTEWALSAIPLGGYVTIAGMAAGDEVRPDDRAAYCNQPAWRRFLVILAGPGTNYLGAVALAAALLLAGAFQVPAPGVEIGPPVPGGAAEAAGIRAGDRVRAADGRPVASWGELVAVIQQSPGRPVELRVERAGADVVLTVTPRDEGGVGRIGVRPGTQAVGADTVLQALWQGGARTWQRAVDVLDGLWQVVTRKQKGQVAGPLGIGQEMVARAREGAGPFLTNVWEISLMLAIFNLLPVPALDGGRLLVLGWELATRRRVNPKVENAVHMVGFVALLALLVWVTLFGDLARLLRK